MKTESKSKAKKIKRTNIDRSYPDVRGAEYGVWHVVGEKRGQWCVGTVKLNGNLMFAGQWHEDLNFTA